MQPGGASRARPGGFMIADLRFALRQLAKAPAFTAVAVCTLALGIGACTAMFGVINAVLLKPLPFQDPDRLVWIENVNGPGARKNTHIHIGQCASR